MNGVFSRVYNSRHGVNGIKTILARETHHSHNILAFSHRVGSDLDARRPLAEVRAIKFDLRQAVVLETKRHEARMRFTREL